MNALIKESDLQSKESEIMVKKKKVYLILKCEPINTKHRKMIDELVRRIRDLQCLLRESLIF